jgi:NodT family efflux transporter outer membrane factor (OMF) lipoprotein
MEPRVDERGDIGEADATPHALRGLLLLVAVAAAGCATATAKAVAPPVAVPGAWQGAGGDAAAPPAGDLSRWWETLGDGTLTELVEKALVANPDLRIAQSRLRQARAQRGLAKIDLLPSIDGALTAGTSKTTGSDARESYAAGLDASWEVDVFGATRKAVSAAQADVEASEASLHDTQVSLAAEVALGYVQLRSYQARLGISRSSLARQEETLDLTRWRAQAGLTSELDVEQARANAEQTRAQIPSLETALAQTEHALATLVGEPPAALHGRLASEGPVPAIPDTVAVGIPADTLRQRPDVRAAERQLVAAIARVGEAKAARFPTFRLSGALGASGPTVGGLLSAETVARSLLGSLTAPVFYRGRIRRQIEIQSEAQEQALVAYEGTVLAALEEVENAIVSLANTRRRRVSLEAAVEASRSAAELARHRYSTGLASYQTVLDTERTVLSAEDSLESSKAEGAQALIRLYKALGGGWTPAPAVAAATRTQGEES